MIQTDEKRVGWTLVGLVEVSTVFIGFDPSNHRPTLAPLVFETMTFDRATGELFGQTRSATWQQAEAAHADAVDIARRSSSLIAT